MKTLKEKIEVMQAYLDGKTIQDNIDDEWTDWEGEIAPHFNWGQIDYRIKPENKQVSYDFSDAENLIGRKIRSINKKNVLLITHVFEDGITQGNSLWTFAYLSKEYEIWNNTLNRWESCTKTVKG